jgi:hypothetical protein
MQSRAAVAGRVQVDLVSWRPSEGWSAPLPRLDSERTLVVAFGNLAADAIAELTAAYPLAKLVGCSSAGEIAGPHISDDALSVGVARFVRTELRVAHVRVEAGKGSRSAGAELARALEGAGLRALFVLSDGLVVNATELLAGIHSVLPKNVAVTGGLAGDGTRFRRTSVLAEGVVATMVVAAVGLYGDALQVSHACGGGWDVFGPERVVTRASGNVLFELDGQPALSLYKSYLGDRAQGLPATALLFPLALRTSAAEKPLVRTILSVNEADQSMTFAGDIPEEGVVQLMRANFDRLIDGASEAGRLASEAGEGPCLSIAISCIGRRLVLGERTEEELDAVLESLPTGAPLVGFYSYGEISPLMPGQCGSLHNQTMALTRYWEA